MARDYRSLSKTLSAQVKRWEHYSFVHNNLEPHECERGGWKQGRRLKRASSDAYSYGYDDAGKLLIAREGQHEFLCVHGSDRIERLMFDRSDIAFMSRHGDAKYRKEAERIRARSEFTLRDGRILEIKHRWFDEPNVVAERYEYDADDRLTKVHVSKPKHTDEFEYDATGQLIRVVWRDPSGHASERFRRAPRQDSLKLLLPELQAKLVEQIPIVLGRAKIKKPAYCLAITTSLEEAPHLLPPKLTVGLVADRDRRLAKGGEFALDDVWLPESMPLHDHDKLELNDRALNKLCDRSRVARANDRPILKMLYDVAMALHQRGLDDVLDCADGFIVFAMDIGGENCQRAARRAAGPKLAKKLVAAGLL
jgi:hypothetical protein